MHIPLLLYSHSTSQSQCGIVDCAVLPLLCSQRRWLESPSISGTKLEMATGGSYERFGRQKWICKDSSEGVSAARCRGKKDAQVISGFPIVLILRCLYAVFLPNYWFCWEAALSVPPRHPSLWTHRGWCCTKRVESSRPALKRPHCGPTSGSGRTWLLRLAD